MTDLARPAPVLTPRTAAVVAVLMVAVAAAILLAMGRVPICTCGEIKLFAPNVNSSDNSQQISDWYTPSHIIHGFLFFFFGWLVWRMAPGRWTAMPIRFLAAIVVEAGWELLENSPFIIDRYRAQTMALDYYGDSVLNSVSDIVAMMIGFWFASKMPVWVTVLVAVFFELLCLYVIRDNLTLNVIMLVHPVQAILDWQTGGAPP